MMENFKQPNTILRLPSQKGPEAGRTPEVASPRAVSALRSAATSRQVGKLSTRQERAFTMIEIALSLAVIGFALVAIIGILPTGMNVQKENRQETIICQDASIWMEAIRSGAQGADDLTNYVIAITNWATDLPGGTPVVRGYDRNGSYGGAATPSFGLLSGNRIIGLLSTPRYTLSSNAVPGGQIILTSNYVVAYVKAISGGAYEKFPQTNSEIVNAGFQYRMVSEVVPYTYYDPIWTNWADPTLVDHTNEPGKSIYDARVAMQQVVTNRQANMYDVRLLFRWPLFPLSGTVGNQRQAFRTIAGGWLMNTNDNGYPNNYSNLFLFQPRTYARPS